MAKDYYKVFNRKPGPHCIELEVTKDIADSFLTRNTFNRPKSMAWVRELEGHLKEGTFTPGTQIAFDEEGVLADGQKRLTAVANTGIPAKFHVYFNAPMDYRGNIDRGQARPVHTSLSLTGMPCDNLLVALAKVFAVAPVFTNERTSVEQIRETLERNSELLHWVRDMKIGNALVSGCVARAAYNGADRARLESFASSFKTGVCQNLEDTAAVTLRDFHRNNKALFAGGVGVRQKAYQHVQSAVQAYLNRKPLKQCKETKTDLYPLVG